MKDKYVILIVIFLLASVLFNKMTKAAWQPNKTHWPRLIFESADLPIVKAHLEAAQNGVEPYKTLWARIQTTAAKAPKTGDKSWGQQNNNANIAKAKAFIYLLTGLNFLPFFRAYNLFMDGNGGTFSSFQIGNFFNNERVANVFNWHIKIRMPNGYENYLFSAFANVDLTVDIFCSYDSNIKPTPPTGSPSQFFPDAGNVIFRSDWGKDAVYMMILGEKEKMRLMGATHEHPDGGSFVIFAYGDLLALDSGYPGYPQHDKVNQAKNHNVILVDGIGPAVDTRLENLFDTASFDFVTANLSYGGANITRNFLFVDNKYFIILDNLASNVEHEYTFLFHGYAGTGLPSSSFNKNQYGGSWKRSKAALEAAVVTDRGVPAYETYEDFHSLEAVIISSVTVFTTTMNSGARSITRLNKHHDSSWCFF